MQRGLGGFPHERLHQDIVVRTALGEPINICLISSRPGRALLDRWGRLGFLGL
ncbi:hypothetical protein [Moorena sp. SIO3H5]|uniref:hypothetical protein n=1 Tax=Moorena sp. SIO3H5 TaxID=2607834 RepID=UPI0013B5FA85|nr:hypothetical protein [Moorena sp. SIO3H5]